MLENLAKDEDAHIIAITEHWKSLPQLRSFHLMNYNLVSSFCRNHGEHGGSAIYVREDIVGKSRDDLTSVSFPRIFECAAYECKTEHSTFVVLSIYRPETGLKCDLDDFFERFSTVLETLCEQGTKCVIAGDFNINLMDNENVTTLRFLSLLESFNVTAKILEPTRVTPLSSTCIDNFLTNIEECSAKVLQSHISDHTAQKFTLYIEGTLKSRGKQRYQTRLINKESINDFNMHLSQINWKDLFSQTPNDIESLWNCFSQQFGVIFNSHFPLRWVSSKKLVHKYKDTPEIKVIKRQLDIFYTISRVRPDALNAYKSLKLKYDRALMEAKQKFFGNKIITSNNKSKTVWQIINKLTGKQKEAVYPKENGDELADNFNKHFVNTKDLNKPHINFPRKCQKSFYMFEVTAKELSKVIKTLKSGTATGYDEIPMSVIKSSMQNIAKPLCFLINKSFVDGIFPSALKIAVLKPLFKKGNKEDFNNYRPISLLTGFSKIFEKILTMRLLSFFEKFNILTYHQHGFTRGKSIETAVFELTKAIFRALESGGVSLGIFLDFSKAFDYVQHRLLLSKLEAYGIRDNQLKLIESYLTNRKQRTSINVNGNYFVSKDETPVSGVPQGSILGPLLFLVYINDLPTYMKTQICSLIMYADDTNLLCSGDTALSAASLSEEAVDGVRNWCLENGIVLNKDKTEYVVFSTKRSNIENPKTLNILGEVVSTTSSTKFLGLYVDCNISWETHTNELSRRLHSSVYTLRVLREQIDKVTLRTVYFANFQSLMCYGILFWGNSSSAQKIFIVQKFALRVICHRGYRESCRGLFKKEELMTAVGLYIYKCILFIYRHKELFHKYLNRNDNTRRMDTYIYPKCRLTQTQQQVEYMCLKLFNILPKSISSIQDEKKFKRKISGLIIEIEPYSVLEFSTYCKENKM